MLVGHGRLPLPDGFRVQLAVSLGRDTRHFGIRLHVQWPALFGLGGNLVGPESRAPGGVCPRVTAYGGHGVPGERDGPACQGKLGCDPPGACRRRPAELLGQEPRAGGEPGEGIPHRVRLHACEPLGLLRDLPLPQRILCCRPPSCQSAARDGERGGDAQEAFPPAIGHRAKHGVSRGRVQRSLARARSRSQRRRQRLPLPSLHDARLERHNPLLVPGL
mmetsp:Transcript_55821/g.154548  ORF Transcript_55821/g.154548 Transcript_55821/m.154548 type:complete len:219 (+) Transcript_55821:612-1268(+)